MISRRTNCFGWAWRWCSVTLGEDFFCGGGVSRGHNKAMEHSFGPKRQQSDGARRLLQSGQKGFERAVGEAVVLGVEIDKV